MEEDYELALKLQEEFNREISEEDFRVEASFNSRSLKRQKPVDDDSDDDDLNKTSNLVHPQWETLDPTPDVKALFNAFNLKFFQGRLKCVELEWSKRMYSCAGICYTRRNRFGLAITIRLSEPLLKLRSRKDLIETLLHEMIHAYCGVLGIREGNGGHGPNFKKIMTGINKITGTNITVYHTFNDEVDVYKTHWWRCNGICQHRSPFFGFVKRTSNRAPGPNDFWWKQHLDSCGGSFLKVREPEKKKIKTDKKQKLNNNNIMRKYLVPQTQNTGNKDKMLDNAQSTIVKPSSSSTNLGNVVGFGDLNTNATKTKPITTFEGSGSGYSLLKPNAHKEIKESSSTVDRDKVRDIWSSKFSTTPLSKPITDQASDVAVIETPKTKLNNFDEKDDWKQVDDDVMIKEESCAIINISSDEEENDNRGNNDNDSSLSVDKKVFVKKSSQDRQREIKLEILETSDINLSEDDIELIDDDYDDVLNNTAEEIDDTNLIDDLFGDDTLLRDFKIQNDVVSTGTSYHRNSNKDVVSCPICQEYLPRENLSDHLDGCTGIKPKVIQWHKSSNTVPKTKKLPNISVMPSTSTPSTSQNFPSTSSNLIDLNKSEDENEGIIRRRGLMSSTHACPVCAQEVDVEKINEHLDICLKLQS